LAEPLIDHESRADVDERISGALRITAGGADDATAYVVDDPPPHPDSASAAATIISIREKPAACLFLRFAILARRRKYLF
jgi:hypothetical protein